MQMVEQVEVEEVVDNQGLEHLMLLLVQLILVAVAVVGLQQVAQESWS
tara:strand:+ start:466 stop:609 length:144 start_codon:yes stop_codon:yes gene_type:complete